MNGLSGLQFARDRELELMRMEDGPGGDRYVTLCSCDPANPYRSIFPKADEIKTTRNQGTAVVLKNGSPVLAVKEYGGLIVPLDNDPAVVEKAVESFINAYDGKRIWTSRKKLFTEFYGEERKNIEDSEVYKLLLEKGYNREYKGLKLWRKASS